MVAKVGGHLDDDRAALAADRHCLLGKREHLDEGILLDGEHDGLAAAAERHLAGAGCARIGAHLEHRGVLLLGLGLDVLDPVRIGLYGDVAYALVGE